ncbi:MAG TPA: aspartate kinase [Tenuifilaceae bacterium]|nr:aspartate kinase [Tenuifilaceae bacterium]
MKGICVFKFGGASVKSAQAIRNLADIIKRYSNKNVLVVISAMGKTTNALERILSFYLQGNVSEMEAEFNQLANYHLTEALDLANGEKDSLLIAGINGVLNELRAKLNTTPLGDYDFCYDQIVSYGELLSTKIVSNYLIMEGLPNIWVDIRSCLISDTNYREGTIDYEESGYLCQKKFSFISENLYVTQGFIAGTPIGTTTTLGREGSDYTAAILANLLNASDVTIWKDVEGVLNADPKIFPNTQKLNFVSYQEAIELAYCGAQIIHPKTIKPIQNKQIPLYVKSFVNPVAEGTCIAYSDEVVKLPPVLVLKRNQVLVSLIPRDYSFVIEDCLSKIFAILYKHKVKVNLVQNSAISFSVCVDEEKRRLPGAIEELGKEFEVKYNSNLELLTIRHYTQQCINELVGSRVVYLQQRTRSTARFVMDAKF